MDIKEQFKQYEILFNNTDIDSICSVGKNHNGLESGINGEKKVYDVLNQFCNKIFSGVLMRSTKNKKISEIDFICELNGYILIVESKEWYGTISKADNPNKVMVSFVNSNGKFCRNARTSPTYALGTFTRDFFDYLNLKYRGSDPHFKRILVFTRNELKIEDGLSPKIEVCYLNDLERVLTEIANSQNPDPIHIDFNLPSWDYYYDEVDKVWYKFAIESDEISGIKVSSIESILINSDEDGAYFKLRDGSIIYKTTDLYSILLSSKNKHVSKRMGFIILNELLHKQIRVD